MVHIINQESTFRVRHVSRLNETSLTSVLTLCQGQGHEMEKKKKSEQTKRKGMTFCPSVSGPTKR